MEKKSAASKRIGGPGASHENRKEPAKSKPQLQPKQRNTSRTGYLGLYGVVSWSTGPNFEDGCGGVTGVTPMELYRQWIEEQARRMGSPLPP
jgi:hypothetical protein